MRLLSAVSCVRRAITIRVKPPTIAQGVEMVLRFEDGTMFIDGPGATFDLPASGSWSGRARVPASFARRIALAPSGGESIVLEFADGYLEVRGATKLRLKAVWEDISLDPIRTVLDLSDRELLRIQARETPIAVVSSGLAEAVRRAELRFTRSLDRAYSALAHYQFSRDDLERVVRNLIVDS